MPPLYLPREKPEHQAPLIWRPASVPMPDVAYLMLPQERGATRLHDWRERAVGGTNTGTWVGDSSDSPTLTFTGSNNCDLGASALLNPGAGAFSYAIRFKHVAALSFIINSRSSSTTAGFDLVGGGGGAGTIGARAQGTSLQGTSLSIALSLGWHTAHVLINAAGPLIALYLDGKFSASVAVSFGTVTNSQNPYLYYRGGTSYTGTAAWVMFWSGRLLTAAEIAAHYADPYVWLREPRRVGMSVAAAAAGNPWYAYAQQ